MYLAEGDTHLAEGVTGLECWEAASQGSGRELARAGAALGCKQGDAAFLCWNKRASPAAEQKAHVLAELGGQGSEEPFLCLQPVCLCQCKANMKSPEPPLAQSHQTQRFCIINSGRANTGHSLEHPALLLSALLSFLRHKATSVSPGQLRQNWVSVLLRKLSGSCATRAARSLEKVQGAPQGLGRNKGPGRSCVQPGDPGWSQDLPGMLCQEQGTSSAPQEKPGEQEGRSSAEERAVLDSTEKPWQTQARSMPPSQPLLPQTLFFWGGWKSWLQSSPAPPGKSGAWHSTEFSSAPASPALRDHFCLLCGNRSLSGPTRRCSGRAAAPT